MPMVIFNSRTTPYDQPVCNTQPHFLSQTATLIPWKLCQTPFESRGAISGSLSGQIIKPSISQNVVLMFSTSLTFLDITLWPLKFKHVCAEGEFQDNMQSRCSKGQGKVHLIIFL